jgi:hypothetical protein
MNPPNIEHDRRIGFLLGLNCALKDDENADCGWLAGGVDSF